MVLDLDGTSERWWVLITVVGGSGMGVVCCRQSLMVVLVGVGVMVVVEERGNVHQENHRHLILPDSICHIKTMWHCFGFFDNARSRLKDGV